jgi:hypothetical protein
MECFPMRKKGSDKEPVEFDAGSRAAHVIVLLWGILRF